MRDSLIRRNKELSGVHLLTPADGWWAGYRDQNDSLHFQPLAVWAWTEIRSLALRVERLARPTCEMHLITRNSLAISAPISSIQSEHR